MENQVPDPNSNPVQLSPPSAPDTKPSLFRSRRSRIILSLFVLLLIPLGVYLLATAGKSLLTEKKPSPTATPNPTIANFPTPSSNLSKNYRDMTYGFSFSYPSSWTLEESTKSGGTEVRFADENGIRLQLDVFDSASLGIGGAFQHLYSLENSSAINMEELGLGKGRMTKIKNREVDDLQAFDYKLEVLEDKTSIGIGSFVNHQEYLLIFLTEEKDKALLDNILSTFKTNLVHE